MRTRKSLAIVIAACFVTFSSSFSISMMNGGEIYGVKGSGWTSPSWRWGYGVGTGHDCAKICRARYKSPESRINLVENLVNAEDDGASFEEIKLILALAWQRGRRDGSDGGPGGYGQVLEIMAEAKRYEDGDEETRSMLLVQDMRERFDLLNPTEQERKLMDTIDELSDSDAARRRCAGLVLSAMGFIKTGL